MLTTFISSKIFCDILGCHLRQGGLNFKGKVSYLLFSISLNIGGRLQISILFIAVCT